MLTHRSEVALVGSTDGHPETTAVPHVIVWSSGPGRHSKKNTRNFVARVARGRRPALGLASLVALTAGCASAFEPRETSALGPSLGAEVDWPHGEPGLAAEVTTAGGGAGDDTLDDSPSHGRRASVPWWREAAREIADAEWFDASSAPDDAAATPERPSAVRDGAPSAEDDEGLRGPEERDALYYLRGATRPLPQQRWHSSDGQDAQESYPALRGYGTPGP